MRNHLIVLAGISSVLCICAGSAWSADVRAPAQSAIPPDHRANYEQNMDFVSKALAKRAVRLNQLTASLVELGESPVESLFGRAYRVGDEWDVVSLYAYRSITPGSSEPAAAQNRAVPGKMASFHYRVTRVQPLQIEIRETADFGLRMTDPKTTSVTLEFDASDRELSKTYHFTDGSSRRALVGGMHSRDLSLELYELDLPDVGSADSIPYRTRDELFAEMPSQLSALAEVSNVSYDPANAKWMEASDGFGRPVDFAWQKGKPWPTYLKTTRGISILVRSSN